MKSAAKAFIWIGMVANFYLIFPIVVGVFALKKLQEASHREELKTMAIVTILFCNILGGIFMLCIEDKELQQPVELQSNKIEKNEQQNNDQKIDNAITIMSVITKTLVGIAIAIFIGAIIFTLLL